MKELTNELKPCPFCGDEDVNMYHLRENHKALLIVCETCNIAFYVVKDRDEDLPNYTSELELIDAWNRRAYE